MTDDQPDVVGRGLYDRFRDAARRYPERPAIVERDQEWSYRQLDRWVDRITESLLASVGTAAPTVGVLGNQSPAAYAGLLATLAAGGTAVPLNPAFPASRLDAMTRAAGVNVIVRDLDVQAAIPGTHSQTRPIYSHADDAGVDVTPVDGRATSCPPETVYVMFTSGSTGAPKAVPISHANISAFFAAIDDHYDFSPEDRFSHAFDLTFDLSIFNLFAAWGASAAVVPVPSTAYRDLPGFLRRTRVTVWFSAPSVIRLVRRLSGLLEDVLSGLRWSLFCGEALPVSDAEGWANAASRSRIDNLYGPTEATIACTGHRWSASSPSMARHGTVAIGRPFRGVNALLLGDDGTPGLDTGELCLAGAQVFSGYLDPSDDTGRFVEHDGRRWYRTGDLVQRISDRDFAYLGRRDDQVKVRGFRAEPGEIEFHLRMHPDVEQAVVVAVDSTGDTTLVAFWTPARQPTEPRPEVTPRELFRHLAARLPAVLVPKRYVRITELPCNVNGKIDRRALRARAAGHRTWTVPGVVDATAADRSAPCDGPKTLFGGVT